jgi:hypothetical protein
MPDLVSRQTMHIRKDGRIVDEQRDDRRATWLAVRTDLVIDVRLREANVLGWHRRQIPEVDQLFGRRTSDGGTSLDLIAPSSCQGTIPTAYRWDRDLRPGR